ncbi:DUF397 domain-containing protein [Streptomyces xanthochromogenes]
MTKPLNWRTSTYTKPDNCVEVADDDSDKVHVRDSKRRSGPETTLSPGAWSAFIEHIRQAEV